MTELLLPNPHGEGGRPFSERALWPDHFFIKFKKRKVSSVIPGRDCLISERNRVFCKFSTKLLMTHTLTIYGIVHGISAFGHFAPFLQVPDQGMIYHGSFLSGSGNRNGKEGRARDRGDEES